MMASPMAMTNVGAWGSGGAAAVVVAKSEIGDGKTLGSRFETVESGRKIIDVGPGAGIARVGVELEHDGRGGYGHLGKAGSDHQRLDPASKDANTRGEHASLVMRRQIGRAHV